jgi:DNA-binding NtrC family response regulator
VRELQALANRIALFDVDTVELSLLPDAIRRRVDRATGRTADAEAADPASSARPTDERDRPRPSREALEQLLTEHGGRVASVARSLALTRQSVYRLLEEHGLSASAFRRKKDA